MTIHGIERFLKVRPFKPFTVRESIGETHRVASPESIRVMKEIGLVVVYPPDGSLVMLDPLQISAAFYPAAKTPKSSKPRGVE
jgi:hypothetical protein